jgi:hypothetical protein
MPILEALAIKGLVVIGKAIAAKGLAAKAGVLAWKLISAYGLSATISTAFVVGVVVGGIYWTKERVANLRDGIKALEDGDINEAAINLARLAISSNAEINMLPDAVHDYLVKIRVSEEQAQDVAKAIRGMENEIVEHVRRLK